MTFASMAKRAERLIADNSPLILTGIGAAGVLTTAYLTGTATLKASSILIGAQLGKDFEREGYELTTKDKLDLTWKLYIPAAGSAVLTISAIIFANRIGTRRAAAVAAAYTISEKAWVEYKDKVIEKLGEKKESAIVDELAQDRINKNPVSNREVIVAGGGSVLCYEEFTGRYFLSDMETLRKAQNDINAVILHDSYASLADLYDLIGLPPTSNCEDVGWHDDKMLEFIFSPTLSESNVPCISVGYKVAPIRYHYSR